MSLIETIISTVSFLAYVLGAVMIVALIVSLVIIAVVLVLLAYSFKTGNFLFPNIMIFYIVFFEGPIKAVLRLFGVDDSRVDKIAINIRNRAMWPTFNRVPYDRRAIFVPQCLRSVDCPARLAPEGIACKSCGRCEISNAKKAAEKLGYKFFVVPGSSFIVRMTRKYKPDAIIGVGCLCEVKEGLDMMHKYKVTSMGVVLERSGCVSTTLNWQKLYDIMQSSHCLNGKKGIVDNTTAGSENIAPPTF